MKNLPVSILTVIFMFINFGNIYSQFGNLPPRTDTNCIKSGPFGNPIFTFNQKKLKFETNLGYQVHDQANIPTQVAANGVYDNNGNLIFAVTLKKIQDPNDPNSSPNISINDPVNLIVINSAGHETQLNDIPLGFIEGWNTLPILPVPGICNQYIAFGINSIYGTSYLTRILYLYRFKYNQDGTISKIPNYDMNGNVISDYELLSSTSDRIFIQVSGAKYFKRTVNSVNRTFIYRDLYVGGSFEEDNQTTIFNNFIKKVSIVEPGYDPVHNNIVFENYMYVQTRNLNYGTNSNGIPRQHFMRNTGRVTDIKLFNESPDRLLISMTDNIVTPNAGLDFPICIKAGDNAQNGYEFSRSPLYLLTESLENNSQFDPENLASKYEIKPMFTNKEIIKDIYSIAVQDNNELDGKIDYLFLSHEGTNSDNNGVSARHDLSFSSFCNSDFTLGRDDLGQEQTIYKFNYTSNASRSNLELTYNYNYLIFAQDIPTGDNVSLVNMISYRAAPQISIDAIIIPNLRCDYHDFGSSKQFATNHQLFKQNYKTGIGSMQPGCIDIVSYSNITSQGNPKLPESTYANTILTNETVDVLPTDDIRFYAGDKVHINYEFKALNGSDFLATITPCSYGICQPCVLQSGNPVSSAPGGGGRYAIDFTLPENFAYNRNVHIIPNPVKRLFTMSLRKNSSLSSEEVKHLSIISIEGKKILEFTKQDSYDISSLKSGTYVLQVITNEDKHYIRLVKW